MKCKTCGKKHDGTYGSGKFCSESCSRGRGTKRPEVWKKRIGDSLRGRPLSEQHKKKLSIKFTGFKFSDERNKKISESLKGRTFSDEHRKHLRLATLKHLQKVKHQQIYPRFNADACRKIDEYGREHGYKFQHALNGGEFYIKELGYWVDGYDKEKNVVVEFYEKQHKRQTERDTRRKQEIIEHLNCEFIELVE